MTTQHSNRPIDMILTHGIVITHAGIFKPGFPKHSDHLGLWIDIDAVQLFGNVSSPMAPLIRRILTSKNVLSIETYMDEIIQQFLYHKITPLTEVANKKQSLSSSQTTQFFKIYEQITTIMIRADKICSKKGISTSLWTPQMQEAGQLHSYWKRRTKAKDCICDKCTINLGLKCGISKDESNELLTIAQCISRQSKARKEFYD